MKMKLKKVFAIFAVLTVLSVLYCPGALAAEALKKGASGDEVRIVQQRLKQWDYYDGPVDGIFGSETEAAVKKFQRAHNLVADGVVGPSTGRAIGITISGGGAKSPSVSSGDTYLLARLVYGEARGEPYIGQVAVAAVVLNRVDSAKFPNTISGVIYQRYAFTAVADGQINLEPDAEAIRAAKDAINGWDPSGGALYYYNPAVATSQWIYSRTVITVIGRHRFAI